MFSKLFTVASLALLAVATPTPGGSGSGSLMCCDKVYSYNEAQGTAGLLDGIPVSVLLDNVGQDIASGCIVRRSLGFFFRSASSQKNSQNILGNQCSSDKTEVNCNSAGKEQCPL